MNVTCGIDQRGRGTRVARGGEPMSRAVGARLYSSPTCSWGVAPGWYELTPLASPGAFNGKCPNSSRQEKPRSRGGAAETARKNSVGSQSHPERLATPRKRVLRRRPRGRHEA